ncbi:hypothetical protein H0H81_008523 [Sphagnurus paluster]|uniref:Uncharacterized protein n=1 Tax=Sphagnurus paluster TaxID=117069 RepID=A0A9P7FQ67_9AGAR|nr:hypothetical protein H0H81_008523 [Sphagnurus paluster]
MFLPPVFNFFRRFLWRMNTGLKFNIAYSTIFALTVIAVHLFWQPEAGTIDVEVFSFAFQRHSSSATPTRTLAHPTTTSGTQLDPPSRPLKSTVLCAFVVNLGILLATLGSARSSSESKVALYVNRGSAKPLQSLIRRIDGKVHIAEADLEIEHVKSHVRVTPPLYVSIAQPLFAVQVFLFNNAADIFIRAFSKLLDITRKTLITENECSALSIMSLLDSTKEDVFVVEDKSESTEILDTIEPDDTTEDGLDDSESTDSFYSMLHSFSSTSIFGMFFWPSTVVEHKCKAPVCPTTLLSESASSMSASDLGSATPFSVIGSFSNSSLDQNNCAAPPTASTSQPVLFETQEPATAILVVPTIAISRHEDNDGNDPSMCVSDASYLVSTLTAIDAAKREEAKIDWVCDMYEWREDVRTALDEEDAERVAPTAAERSSSEDDDDDDPESIEAEIRALQAEMDALDKEMAEDALRLATVKALDRDAERGTSGADASAPTEADMLQDIDAEIEALKSEMAVLDADLEENVKIRISLESLDAHEAGQPEDPADISAEIEALRAQMVALDEELEENARQRVALQLLA